MKMEGNSILITGGATGIGYALAKYFHQRGNKLLICGRREEKLKQAAEALSGVHTFACDVANPAERYALLEHTREVFPELNILINNAGIQCDVDLTQGFAELSNGVDEIQTNLEAPIFLSALFVPFLAGKEDAVIVHISSSLAFMIERGIGAGMPIYCATKAGLHAFALAQRKQLRALGIRVVEMAPPMVASELNPQGRKKREKPARMLSAEEYVDKALAQMEQGKDEIK
ncbi:MAG: SDR family NAD(P)-dependent oxidoreductase [Proteobacteria bacterium]|nr:SDR family NAD(P)-dependent oxidoreductase [Cystobacterineae bacterium]MCL2259299.1 SDR family NAD(P)-dependent oxidoreductase [Cystobacterineae bacterium]MCL2314270.1 SDR family NAD(P)-dependent oxidoreductase [Pseudomonadota bacterium]